MNASRASPRTVRSAWGGLVRAYRPSDYPAVRRLWSAAGLHVGPSDSRTDLERTRRRDPDLFLVATTGDALVGAVLG